MYLQLCGGQDVLEFGEDLLDRIEIGAVGRQEDHVRSHGADRGARRLALVASEIVENDDVAGVERRGEDLLDVSREALAIDRPIEDAGRIDPVATQGSDEGQRLPVTVRDIRPEPRASCAPAPYWRHVGLGPSLIGPSLIDEDETRRIDAAWRYRQRSRLRATSGRSCSLASTVFFEAEIFLVDEVPDRAIADHDATLGQFRLKTAQR
jgi:hypothetical protein